MENFSLQRIWIARQSRKKEVGTRWIHETLSKNEVLLYSLNKLQAMYGRNLCFVSVHFDALLQHSPSHIQWPVPQYIEARLLFYRSAPKRRTCWLPEIWKSVSKSIHSAVIASGRYRLPEYKYIELGFAICLEISGAFSICDHDHLSKYAPLRCHFCWGLVLTWP